MYYVLLRGFFAVEDTRTPALVNLFLTAVNLGVGYALYRVLPPEQKVSGLAFGYAVAYIATTVVFWLILRRRFDGLDSYVTIRTFVRLLLAGAVAGLVGYLELRLLDGHVGTGKLGALVTCVAVAPVVLAVFWLVASRLRVTEVVEVTEPGPTPLAPARPLKRRSAHADPVSMAGVHGPAGSSRDTGAVVVGWFARIAITLALIGTLAFDGISIALAKAHAPDIASDAADAATVGYVAHLSPAQAEQAAAAKAASEGAKLGPTDVVIVRKGAQATITVTVHDVPGTMLLGHLPGTDQMNQVSATATRTVAV